MNTKKVFFGFMAVAFLAMAALSTTVVDEETLTNQTQIKKGHIVKR